MDIGSAVFIELSLNETYEDPFELIAKLLVPFLSSPKVVPLFVAIIDEDEISKRLLSNGK